MISIIIVSEREKIAAGVANLVREIADPAIEVRSCQSDRHSILTTIDSIYTEDEVAILDDGNNKNQILAAIELLEDCRQDRVRLCNLPLVEGAIALISAIETGGNIDSIVDRAELRILSKNIKQNKLKVELKLSLNIIAEFVNLARTFQAKINLENLNNHLVIFDAKSIDRLLYLDLKQNDEIIISATGFDDTEAIDSLSEFLSRKELIIGLPQKEKELPIQGIPAVGGVASGTALFYRPLLPEITAEKTTDPATEWVKIREAFAYVKAEIERIQNESNRDFFEIYLLFLEDFYWRDRVKKLIFERKYTAANAWKTTIETSLANYDKAIDPYLENLIIDLGIRILRLLQDSNTLNLEISQSGILLAYDLSPTEIIQLRSDRIVGICLAAGSIISKTVKIAASKNIPMVVGLGAKLWQISGNQEIVIDGYTGAITREANEEQLQELNFKKALQKNQNEWGLEPTTQDGYRIPLMVNITGVEDAKHAVELGTESIGLFRSEYLFLERSVYPEEAEQIAVYQAIAEVLKNRPLTILTLNLIDFKEPNPLLGWHGIRQALDSPKIFKTQLKAILKVSAKANIKILLPMVSSIRELKAAKEIIAEVKQELKAAKIEFGENIPIGIMVQSCAAIVSIDRLATEVDFLTIDTDDLAQYIMSADRTNFRVAHLADPFEPAVLRSIQKVVIAARVRGIKISVCGQMASDSLGIPVLLGLGIDELVVSGGAFFKVMKYIDRVNLEDVENIAKDLLQLESAITVKQSIFNRLSGI